jgi:hypothetical protein
MAFMAAKRDSFPTNHRGRPQKYPWQVWTDGSIWQIRQGDDYDISTQNMQVNLHVRANELGHKVRTQKIKNEPGEGLFQFLPNKERQAVVHGY